MSLVVAGIDFLFSVLLLAVIVGGVDQMSQALVLAKKPHIIIGECVCFWSYMRKCSLVTHLNGENN